MNTENNQNNLSFVEATFDWDSGCFITAWGRPLTEEEEHQMFSSRGSLSEMAMNH